jgi:hypothetical protein
VTKTKRTAYVHIYYNDMMVVNTQESIDTIRSVIMELEPHCHAEIERAMNDIGAKDVSMHIVVY